jgi:leucyl aminopeptidase (aminopeptidase T)
MSIFSYALRKKVSARRHTLIKYNNEVQSIFCKFGGGGDKWSDFFYKTSSMVLQSHDLQKYISPCFFLNHSFEKLRDYNYNLHKEKLPEFYPQSYANPQYAVKCFGEGIGQLCSILYTNVMAARIYAYEYNVLMIYQITDLFLKFYHVWHDTGGDYKKLVDVIRKNEIETMYERHLQLYEKKFSPKYDYYSIWLKNADLTDVRYLFYYGKYVSDDSIVAAKFLNNLPDELIDKVMHRVAKGYIDGFAETGKDYRKKKTLFFEVPIGMERLARSLMIEMETRYKMKPCISGVFSGNFDQQLLYDHRFDNAIYLDDEFARFYARTHANVMQAVGPKIKKCSGGVHFDIFGEAPFTPENKAECLKYTSQQIELNQQMSTVTAMDFNEYYRRDENSYCIVGFPTPAIGRDFAEIFMKTIEINMLCNDKWLKIQQYLVDALDKGEYAEIKGHGKNTTNIIVRFPHLADPERQTNFYNCGATQNIPVGEVFTTPELKGTNGRLHLPFTYLNGFAYHDLVLDFVDGRVTTYSCKNYDNEEANKKYIEENLLFPHKSLPLGEFAIGTNTLAYQVSKDLDIMNVLPILIVEKMGPHFAIGDTCYSYEEDMSIYNPDKKEIVAKDNDQSRLRKVKPEDAYLYVHVDITLPYEEIEYIRVVTQGRDFIDIIKDGRFVLPGTTELNSYLK